MFSTVGIFFLLAFRARVENKFLHRFAYTWSLRFLLDLRCKCFQYNPWKKLENRFSTVNKFLHWHHTQDHRGFFRITVELILAALGVRFLQILWLYRRSKHEDSYKISAFETITSELASRVWHTNRWRVIRPYLTDFLTAFILKYNNHMIFQYPLFWLWANNSKYML